MFPTVGVHESHNIKMVAGSAQAFCRQLLRVIFFLVDKNRIFEIFAAENKKSALCLVMMDDLLSLQNVWIEFMLFFFSSAI